MERMAPLAPEVAAYALELGEQAMLYVPGGSGVRLVPSAAAAALRRAGLRTAELEPALAELAATLRAEAAATAARTAPHTAGGFAPVALTVYPTSRCNLGCVYCHTDASPRRSSEPEMAAFERALDSVVANCIAAAISSVTVVVHGGGEPTLARGFCEAALAYADRSIVAAGLEPFYYVSTHGALDDDTADWVAQRFHRVGLSCDGPPEVQDTQRPRAGGGGSARAVLRVARRWRDAKVHVAARATITAATVGRQVELVDWFLDEIGADEIRFEPLYVRGRAVAALSPEPRRFARELLRAQEQARQRGVGLLYAGVRLEELHGPFCNVDRQVLALTPDGLVTGCFDATERRADPGGHMMLGAAGKIDPALVASHRLALGRRQRRCDSCFNRFHCARECPSWCAARGDDPGAEPGPLCVIAQNLALAWLCQRVGIDWESYL
jgi:uncharacterized protein